MLGVNWFVGIAGFAYEGFQFFNRGIFQIEVQTQYVRNITYNSPEQVFAVLAVKLFFHDLQEISFNIFI